MYGKNVFVGFHRLAIMSDTFSANQPIIIENGDKVIVFVCNGEIYNHRELKRLIVRKRAKNGKAEINLTRASDCEVIPRLYMEYGYSAFPELFEYTEGYRGIDKPYIRGEFAFVLLEFDRGKHLQRVIAGRDSVGVRPLYISTDQDNNIGFSSEMKGFEGLTDNEVKEFPPGHIFCYNIDKLGKMDFTDYNYYKLHRMIRQRSNNNETELLQNVYKSVIDSVNSRLDADKPIAFLLSGGVDSSLVAGISAKILGRPIRTFCCGMNEGTDLVYARKVAEWIGSEHTEVMFTADQGLAAINDVIRTTETWDTTTIRASVGQYLVSKWIGEKTDCKVLLVGEGPDEVCSSYLFNWYAPNGDALHNCAIEYINKIHLYDGRRSDRCVSRWGLETRVPYLDPAFIHEYWKIPSEWRMPGYKGVEKWWLRKAFEESGVLPNEVLWRKKEAFSDGVSGSEKSWFQVIQEWVEDKISDQELIEAKEKYPHCTPQTKEALYYRKVFVELFGENRQTIIPHYWQPKWSSDGKEVTEYIDPSARVLDVYNN
jgi:asparagine synthase (glutamine-hydrolysing)